ncbi:Mitochondrial tRNAs modification protein [Marasmius crinis-equi]|uniref:Mitochondrial tRNAs modification protein n=1 Tax=Marasmius crinis-equi TaxID=585013 RepID=A0ABR3FSX0_9AGAR
MLLGSHLRLRWPSLPPFRSYNAFYRRFTVLALESSADDTCCAIVDSDRRILANVRIKQNELHEQYGGIYPAAAVMAHQRNMVSVLFIRRVVIGADLRRATIPCEVDLADAVYLSAQPVAIKRALEQAKMDVNDVDGIAFTRGPGMPGCLGVGCHSAKALAAALGKPLVGVHHMQAHALTPLLTSSSSSEIPEFPFLTLLASGGHTLLLLATSPSKFRILATALDSSIGRTIDKAARMLQVPGWAENGPGAALEKFCAEGESTVPTDFASALPMPGRLAFSFAGLHSHIERYMDKVGGVEQLTEEQRRGVGRAVQDAAFGQIIEKVQLCFQKVLEKERIQVGHFVMSGGVASNELLRTRLRTCLEDIQRTYEYPNPIIPVFPPPALCTDNAAMIAWTSLYRFAKGNTDPLTIGPRSKWSIEDLHLGEDQVGDGLWGKNCPPLPQPGES